MLNAKDAVSCSVESFCRNVNATPAKRPVMSAARSSTLAGREILDLQRPSTLNEHTAFCRNTINCQPHYHDLQELHTTGLGPHSTVDNTKSAHRTTLVYHGSTKTSCCGRSTSRREHFDVRRAPRALNMSARDGAERAELLQGQDRSCGIA